MPRALAIAALLSALPAIAQEADAGVSPQEMEEIEKALQADANAAKTEEKAPAPAAPASFSLQSLNPDLSFVADFALAGFSTDEPLQAGGHDPQKNGFNLQQLELSVSASVDPYLRFDSNIVFAQFGVEIEEAYATTLALPYGLQVRAGQFLTRFGRLNNTHPHAWTFVDQPFAIGRIFGGEGNRGLGVETSWLAPTPWYVELVGSATDATGEGTARSFYGATDLGVYGPRDLQLTGAAKQFFELSDDLSLAWGLSFATGPNPTGHSNHTDVYGTDVYLKYRPLSDGGNPTILSLQTELLYRRRQIPGDVLSDASGYAQVFWRFEQRWGVAGRYELGSPAYGLDGKRATDPLDAFWTGDRHRASANVTFWPTEFSRLRLQASTDVLAWQDKPNYAVFLAFDVGVGAHGAHAF
jgi:hypothetical protein